MAVKGIGGLQGSPRQSQCDCLAARTAPVDSHGRAADTLLSWFAQYPAVARKCSSHPPTLAEAARSGKGVLLKTDAHSACHVLPCPPLAPLREHLPLPLPPLSVLRVHSPPSKPKQAPDATLDVTAQSSITS